MNRQNIELHILIGLPASGKTTYAREFAQDKYKRVEIVGENEVQMSFFDKDKNCRYKTMENEKLFSCIESKLYYRPAVLIIDGLFLNTKRVMDMIDFVASRVDLNGIILDYWPENKEECLRNDYMRRRTGSELSIKRLHIDVDFNVIREKYPKAIVKRHEVYHTPDYVIFFREHGICDLKDERYFCSDTWCKGGEAWSYMSDRWAVEAENPPESFCKLDELLYDIHPNFSMRDYQLVMEQCVQIKEEEESDYYSRTTQAHYVCNLEKLYDFLKERGYLENANAFTDIERNMLKEILSKTSEEMSELEQLCFKLINQKNLKMTNGGRNQ